MKCWTCNNLNSLFNFQWASKFLCDPIHFFFGQLVLTPACLWFLLAAFQTSLTDQNLFSLFPTGWMCCSSWFLRWRVEALVVIGRWPMCRFSLSKSNRRNQPVLIWLNKCDTWFPIASRATTADIWGTPRESCKQTSVNTSSLPKKKRELVNV